MRACLSAEGVGFEPEHWRQVAQLYRRVMGFALERKSGRAEIVRDAKAPAQVPNIATGAMAARIKKDKSAKQTLLPDLAMADMLQRRVRYFTDGAVIGGKAFVNEVFAAARDRFGPKRRNGARKLRGPAAAAAGLLWSARDLRVDSLKR